MKKDEMDKTALDRLIGRVVAFDTAAAHVRRWVERTGYMPEGNVYFYPKRGWCFVDFVCPKSRDAKAHVAIDITSGDCTYEINYDCGSDGYWFWQCEGDAEHFFEVAEGAFKTIESRLAGGYEPVAVATDLFALYGGACSDCEE